MSYKPKGTSAPCLYLGFNEVTQKDQLFYPTVRCDFDCEHCGWNHDEQKRRIRTGKRQVWNGITTIVFKRRNTHGDSE